MEMLEKEVKELRSTVEELSSRVYQLEKKIDDQLIEENKNQSGLSSSLFSFHQSPPPVDEEPPFLDEANSSSPVPALFECDIPPISQSVPALQPPTPAVSSVPNVYGPPISQLHVPTTPITPVVPYPPMAPAVQPTTPIVPPTTPIVPPTTPTVPPTTPLQPINCSPGFLVYTRSNSCSRGNFAANLNRAWFTEDERITRNVRGKNNKLKLSPRRIQRIYDAAFQMYPVSSKENEKNAWSECVKAIDGVNRQLKRRQGKEN